MRVLITGASGLAGGHLARACAQAGDEVIGISRSGQLAPWASDPDGEHRGIEGRAVDLRDDKGVARLLAEVEPEIVYHLAALTSVGQSWDDPATTIEENVSTAANLLEALRHRAPGARVIWASTCEVYGAADELPIPETAPFKPANPYAVSKLTGDLLAGLYSDAHRLQITRVRPFNHAGPGQRPIFLLSSLAEQGARARLDGAKRIQIVTGNPDTRRDFTDARDVARAYRLLAERGLPGVFNVCSGVSVSAAEQVALLAELLDPIEVDHVVDPNRVRAHEVMEIRGSPARLRAAVGWQPEITLRETMRDTLSWWEHELSSANSDSDKASELRRQP
ncbi:MAG: GDP-mannose 4,6-dehydratase [Solirubrobacteraceae bacterium]